MISGAWKPQSRDGVDAQSGTLYVPVPPKTPSAVYNYVCNYDPDVISITEPWLLHLSLIWSPYCYIDKDLIEKVQ